jgi:hypothetical protein
LGAGRSPVLQKPQRCSVGSHAPVAARTAWAAIVLRPTTVRRAQGGRPLARFGTANANGAATVLSVLGRVDRGCPPPWYRVRLPMRPNGVTGWVRASDVRLFPVWTQLVVDVSAREVMLYRRGRLVIRTAAAVGSPATPTPIGTFYVNQRLIPPDAGGPFGPGAIGISAFSDVLTGWVQGGPIAIHGTNAPWSIGKNVSNGCVRVRNAVLRRIFWAAAEGTPVVIRA